MMIQQEQQQQKRKRMTEKERGEHDRSMKEVKALGEQLLTSRAHINNLPLLLAYVSPSSPPHYALESLLSLQSFFTPLLPNLPSPSYKSPSSSIPLDDAAVAPQEDPEVIYWIWVRSKFDAFIDSLLLLSISPLSQPTLRDIAVDSIMEFVKLGNGGAFQSSIYHKFLRTLVHSSSPIDFLSESFASKYFKFLDVRYFTYVSLARLAEALEAKDNIALTLDVDAESHSRASEDLSIQKLHYILSHIPPVEALDDKSCHEMWTVSGNSGEHLQPPRSKGNQKKAEKSNSNGLSSTSIAKKMKRKFTKAWITFLRLPLSLDVYKEVLVSLPQLVIPHLSNPIMLCDFLTRSYDIGGVVSVMSLSSLYILMTQHGLEYPNFYEKLYALLVPSIFLAKHRAKFFQLLDSCLKSSLIPAYLAAAFTKKLSRMSLFISPSGDLVVVALIHNLLRRHPSINCLVHRENGGETANADVNADISSRRLGIDNFKDNERDPMKSNAMRSSLWEIDTLRHHYCPPVSRFVLSLEEDLTIRAKTTEVTVSDFCSGSYATIFREEIRRRIKQVPLAFYKEAPDMLFSETEFAGWTFECEEGREGNALDDGNIPTSASEEHDHTSAKRQRVEMHLS